MLSKYASNASFSRGRLKKEIFSDQKSNFERDRDRIINSTSFRRLQYKTQVFANHEGDHFRTRLTHSLEVAQISRYVSRILCIDEDLSEAIALSHDIGHAPFGHAGEDALKVVMQNYGGFDHNAQTLKTLIYLESRYHEFDGLNLTWETLEGITKHNGPLNEKYITEFIVNFNQIFDLDLNKYPSLEAQVAAISDDIAYNNHDIEDAFRANLINLEDLMSIELLKNLIQKIQKENPFVNKTQVINQLTRELKLIMINELLININLNLEKHKIKDNQDIRNAPEMIAKFSDEFEIHNQQIKSFLKNKVYNHFKVNRMTNKARRIVKELFFIYFEDYTCLPTEWKKKIDGCNSKQEIAIIIADYIAGMTDRYAIKEYLSFFDLSINDNELLI